MTVSLPRTIADVFAPVVAADPDREALVTRSGRWSYAELDRLSARAAHALSALGVQPGDRVAGALPNDLDVILAFHGAMRLGAVWVGINRAFVAPEKQFLLDDSGASLLLCDEPTAEQLRSAGAGATRVVTVEDGPGEWHDALAAAPADPFVGDVDPFAPAGLAYTSGTTGYPKGATHSQHNLLVPGAVLGASRGWGPSLRKGDFLALTILNMQVLTTLTTAQAGGCAVIFDRNDPVSVAEWIRDERVTVWNGPPALIHSLAYDDAVAADDPGHARRGVERRWRLPGAGARRVRGEVRQAGADDVRVERSAHGRDHRRSRRCARGRWERTPTSPRRGARDRRRAVRRAGDDG